MGWKSKTRVYNLNLKKKVKLLQAQFRQNLVIIEKSGSTGTLKNPY